MTPRIVCKFQFEGAAYEFPGRIVTESGARPDRPYLVLLECVEDWRGRLRERANGQFVWWAAPHELTPEGWE